MYLKAQPSSEIQNRTASSVKVFLEMWKRRSPPLMRSTTRYLIARQQHSTGKRLVSTGRAQVDAHVFDILEAVSEVANKGMVDMFEHATLSDNVPYAF